jgi:NTE family protein
MVQRGYGTSKKVLFGLRAKADLYYSREVHQYCFLGTRGPLVHEGQTGILHLVRNNNQSDLCNRAIPASGTGIGLALGGGFARGFAHLGVLQVLEQNQIPIACIAGTSVGSILGAAYASGAPLARIIATCRTLRFRDIARWRVSRLGLASNHRLGDLIERVFDSRQFEDLRLPMAVVATDLNTGEPVVFTEGNLVDAIRASCAFPGLFEPVQIGTRYLADGGLVAPVPTRAARDLGAAFVLGVSVGIQDGHRGAPSNVFQVVARAVHAAQKHQTEAWERHADLVLRPDVQSLAWDDFDRADEAIEAGAAVARRALPRIHKFLERAEATGRDQQAEAEGYLWLAEAAR